VNNRSGRPRYFNSIGDMVGAMETKRLLLIRLKIISSIEGTIIPYLTTEQYKLTKKCGKLGRLKYPG
jgi:hypothetical protein